MNIVIMHITVSLSLMAGVPLGGIIFLLLSSLTKG